MLDKIPLSAKALMIKFWFAGVVYFFVCLFFAGTVGSTITLLLIMGLLNGLVGALVTNTVIRFMESPDQDVHRWLLFYGRSYGSFCCNVIYGVVLTALSYAVFSALHATADPLLFGVVYCLWDVLFLQGKRLIVKGKRQ